MFIPAVLSVGCLEYFGSILSSFLSFQFVSRHCVTNFYSLFSLSLSRFYDYLEPMTILHNHRSPLRLVLVVAFLLVISYFTLSNNFKPVSYDSRTRPFGYVKSSYDWSKRRQKHPIQGEYKPLPTGPPAELRRIQHDFDLTQKWTQENRRREITKSFKQCWNLYSKYAWGRDQLNPLSLTASDSFSGWGATLVDTLDSLLILDMQKEFQDALTHVARIDWSKTAGDEVENQGISLFETNIRYLGGLLSAYDLSGEAILLRKAIELGDMLYNGFDTPQRMPSNAFNFAKAKAGQLELSNRESLAHVGSLSMEFTRLSQLTGDFKYFDAIERVKENLQDSQTKSKLPGMWPVQIDVASGFGVGGDKFTMGSMADSAYEYLPKMYMLLGGLDESYKEMYIKASTTAKNYMLFRPMLPDKNVDILFSGIVYSNGAGSIERDPQGQHLACFVGGMYALGARIFTLGNDMETAAQLTRGCAWAYKVMPTHVMPEEFTLLDCKEQNLARCWWDQERWDAYGNKRLPKGFRSAHSLGYQLRPEAIESVFYMWRVTGEEVWRDTAWEMFLAIRKLTETATGANSIVNDVTRDGNAQKLDWMEVSFFLVFGSSRSLRERVKWCANDSDSRAFGCPRLSSTST